MASIRILVQEQDYDLAAEYQRLRTENPKAGAIVTFSGLVRDFNAEGSINGIYLEHYPAMTQKSLHSIADKALQRWPVSGITLIHRVGSLQANDQIVLTAVAAQHRAEAFAAAAYLMDYLKTEAPFWKQERGKQGDRWVEGKESDQRARDRW